jgi:uncharacterized protein YndB with AHSA1/START domain
VTGSVDGPSSVGAVVGTISEERHLAAAPDEVYAVVADPVAMATLSPECQRVVWVDEVDGPTPGARFRGYNRHGAFRWRTTATVTDARPGERFAYDVSVLGVPVASWAYDLEPVDGGTLVRESTTDRRGPLLTWTGPLTTGVRDRADHNRQGIRETLAGLAELVEQRSGP